MFCNKSKNNSYNTLLFFFYMNCPIWFVFNQIKYINQIWCILSVYSIWVYPKVTRQHVHSHIKVITNVMIAILAKDFLWLVKLVLQVINETSVQILLFGLCNMPWISRSLDRLWLTNLEQKDKIDVQNTYTNQRINLKIKAFKHVDFKNKRYISITT